MLKNMYGKTRGWFPNFATGLNIIYNRHSSKSISVIKLSFCQNDPLIGGSFWQKDSLITHILFELWLITLLCIVLVFLTQTLIWMFLAGCQLAGHAELLVPRLVVCLLTSKHTKLTTADNFGMVMSCEPCGWVFFKKIFWSFI